MTPAPAPETAFATRGSRTASCAARSGDRTRTDAPGSSADGAANAGWSRRDARRDDDADDGADVDAERDAATRVATAAAIALVRVANAGRASVARSPVARPTPDVDAASRRAADPSPGAIALAAVAPARIVPAARPRTVPAIGLDRSSPPVRVLARRGVPAASARGDVSTRLLSRLFALRQCTFIR
jgi:hypothetical protein